MDVYLHANLQHVKLRSVDLSFNHLTALDALSALVDLRELKVYGNQITSLDGLERCVMASMRQRG